MQYPELEEFVLAMSAARMAPSLTHHATLKTVRAMRRKAAQSAARHTLRQCNDGHISMIQADAEVATAAARRHWRVTDS